MKVAAKRRQDMLKLKAKKQAAAAAAAPKQTRQQARQKSEKDITFIVLQQNVRSLTLSERFEELTQEVEGCRWDAILISETWRANEAEILETQQGHTFRKIRESTRSWNSSEQEVAKTYQLDRVHHRARHINVDQS